MRLPLGVWWVKNIFFSNLSHLPKMLKPRKYLLVINRRMKIVDFSPFSSNYFYFNGKLINSFKLHKRYFLENTGSYIPIDYLFFPFLKLSFKFRYPFSNI